MFNCVPSTLHSYDNQVNRFFKFCQEKGYLVQHVPMAVVVETSVRPRSLLNTCSAAIACLAQAMDFPNPVNRDVKNVINGLVKSGTQCPMEKSKTMPRKPFISLFMSWAENHDLNTEDLHLATLET